MAGDQERRAGKGFVAEEPVRRPRHVGASIDVTSGCDLRGLDLCRQVHFGSNCIVVCVDANDAGKLDQSYQMVEIFHRLINVRDLGQNAPAWIPTTGILVSQFDLAWMITDLWAWDG